MTEPVPTTPLSLEERAQRRKLLNGLGLKGAARMMNISPTRRFIYVQNQKVACTSIKLSLQRAEMNDPEFMPESIHSASNKTLKNGTDLDLATLTDALENFYIFSFVRNPFARLYSAYMSKMVPRKRGNFRVEAGFERDSVPSFPDFVDSVVSTDPADHNPHWRPQSMSLMWGALRYDFIGRLETFDADWAKVVAALDLPPWPLEVRNVNRRGPPGSYRDHYTPKMVCRVAEVYADDFKAFSYDPTL